MRRMLTLLAALAVLACVGVAIAQETVPNQGGYFPQPGNRKIDGDLWVTGTTYHGTGRSDGSVFLPATTYCKGDTATQQNGLIAVRVAANDWALARTGAGAETINYTCNISSWLQRTATGGGIKITSMALVYQVTVANLTTHTFNSWKNVTYANGSANTLSSGLTGTVTLSTASTANPYLTTITPTTAAFFPTAVNMSSNIDATAVLANTGIFRLYGVQVNFTRVD